MRKDNLIKLSNNLVVLILAVIALNIISSSVFHRWDVTEDRIYSISEGSKSLLKKLITPIEIKFYFSRNLPGLPVMIKTYANRVEEVLQEYVSYADGKLTVETIDVEPDSSAQEWAGKYGIRSAHLPNGGELYFGLVFLKGSKEIAIPYIDPRKEASLEYSLSEAIVKLNTSKKIKVGIYSSLPVMGSGGGNMFMRDPNAKKPWYFVELMRKVFDVVEVKADVPEIEGDINVLLVIHPKFLPETFQYAIDQFVLRGGKLILAVDPVSRTDLLSMDQMARFQGGQKPSSDLPRLLSSWGVQYDSDQLVGDLSHPLMINVGGVGLSYPLFIDLRDLAFSKETVITANLKSMIYAEGGYLSKKDGSTYQFIPLLKTSTNSGTTSAGMFGIMQPVDIAKKIENNNKKRVLAAFVKGKFKTSFPDGFPKTASSDKKNEPKEKDEKKPTQPHLDQMKKNGLIVVIADVDFMHDSNAVQRKFSFGGHTIGQMRGDNLNFLFNAVEFLSGNDELVSIRSSGKITRPFDKVTALRNEATERWKKVEEDLNREIGEVQKKLASLQQKRSDGNFFSLSPSQQAEIKRFREKEASVRGRLREVRKKLRKDIELLGKQLVFANMVVVPMIVIIFGFIIFNRRQKKARRRL